ncbi:hypothetical protein [Amycolatopsis sp. NPDC058986]|uniref:hypothetical protein n=1 Tax=unclassified Amycolatopsis TaxID=2618356 RepID=UPI0036734D4A
MDEERWGFEEDDEWEEDQPPSTSDPQSEDTESITGSDGDAIITVHIASTGQPIAVKLEPGWKQSVDPRALHGSVVAAANTATMQALAWQVENPQGHDLHMWSSSDASQAEESPLTAADMDRLSQAADAEIKQFMERATANVDSPVSRESAGGHVSGTALNGRITECSIDPNWAASARNAEIESEVLDVLQALHTEGAPNQVIPDSPAINEIMSLLFDPQRLMRRTGLIPRSSPTEPEGDDRQ